MNRLSFLPRFAAILRKGQDITRLGFGSFARTFGFEDTSVVASFTSVQSHNPALHALSQALS